MILYFQQCNRDSVSYKDDVFLSTKHAYAVDHHSYLIQMWTERLHPWNSFLLFHNNNLGVEYNLVYAEQLQNVLMENRSMAYCWEWTEGDFYFCQHIQLSRTSTIAVYQSVKRADLSLICVRKWEKSEKTCIMCKQAWCWQRLEPSVLQRLRLCFSLLSHFNDSVFAKCFSLMSPESRHHRRINPEGDSVLYENYYRNSSQKFKPNVNLLFIYFICYFLQTSCFIISISQFWKSNMRRVC